MTRARLGPGATIGILGGGQLGRMLAMAAAKLGMKTHIFAPEADSPAFDVAAARTIADYADERALAAFAKAVDVVTYEFENVPAATAAFLARLRPVLPDARALETAQDRLAEKHFLNHLAIATAPFAAVDDMGALVRAVGAIGRPAILKTRRFGYDGKGQVVVGADMELGAAWRALGARPAILEGFVAFEREISVIAARSAGGEFRAFDVCENVHEHHILAHTSVPARITAATEAAAPALARRICEALDYVGVIAVEMFVRTGGALTVNELAPRVHNSGHWTLDGAATSQFEQHIRAICGWPLGDTRRHGAVEMRNVIGDAAADFAGLAAEPGASLHLYGKAEIRAGRKMGHVTRVLPDA